jgi:NAD(P)-dependent dehydrogenase (short-subunit alcohol dehydrogenase family)
MNQKTVIITGANSGIGKAAAQAIAAEGHRVILACRNIERGEKAKAEMSGTVFVRHLDLASRKSIHDFTDQIHREYAQVDALINNAADFDISRKRRELTADGFERIWFTNHLAPVLLTDRLMDILITSPQGRILNVSSKGLLMHPFQTVDLKDPMFNHRPYSVAKAYYQSKLAQIMYTMWLSKQLTGTMVTANCIRVTNVKLDLSRFPDLPQWLKNLYAVKALFSISPEQMATTYVRAALNEEAKDLSGTLIDHPFKETYIPAYARDPLCMEQVMQLTYKQLGIPPTITYEQP